MMNNTRVKEVGISDTNDFFKKFLKKKEIYISREKRQYVLLIDKLMDMTHSKSHRKNSAMQQLSISKLQSTQIKQLKTLERFTLSQADIGDNLYVSLLSLFSGSSNQRGYHQGYEVNV